MLLVLKVAKFDEKKTMTLGKDAQRANRTISRRHRYMCEIGAICPPSVFFAYYLCNDSEKLRGASARLMWA